MIFRNNTRRFSLLALLLALSLGSNLSFTSARPSVRTCIPPSLALPASMPPAEYTVGGWGNNDFGQLSIPAGLTNVTAISAALVHNLALKSDGTVVGWIAEWLRRSMAVAHRSHSFQRR